MRYSCSRRDIDTRAGYFSDFTAFQFTFPAILDETRTPHVHVHVFLPMRPIPKTHNHRGPVEIHRGGGRRDSKTPYLNHSPRPPGHP